MINSKKKGAAGEREFANYCKEKGFEFMTLGDAWRIRKPIYEWYETF